MITRLAQLFNGSRKGSPEPPLVESRLRLRVLELEDELAKSRNLLRAAVLTYGPLVLGRESLESTRKIEVIRGENLSVNIHLNH